MQLVSWCVSLLYFKNCGSFLLLFSSSKKLWWQTSPWSLQSGNRVKRASERLLVSLTVYTPKPLSHASTILHLWLDILYLGVTLVSSLFFTTLISTCFSQLGCVCKGNSPLHKGNKPHWSALWGPLLSHQDYRLCVHRIHRVKSSDSVKYLFVRLSVYLPAYHNTPSTW